MNWFAELMVAFGQGLSVMALVAICQSGLDRLAFSKPVHGVLVGTVFGLGAALTMMSPAVLAAGVTMDLCSVFVGFAGAFLGFPAMLASVAVASAARLAIGGTGVVAGTVGIVLAGLIGFGWRRAWRPRRETGIGGFAVLAVFLSLPLAALVLLPVARPVTVLMQVWTLTLPAFVVSSIALGMMMKRERRLIEREQALIEYGRTDQMTSLSNRPHFVGRITDALAAQRHGGDGFAIFMLDIDHFKSVNDTYGHQAGDDALKAVSNLLRVSFSRWDLAARYGGEEFAVFLPFVSPAQATASAERLRRAVSGLRIRSGHVTFAVTISIGVATSFEHESDIEALLAKVDDALYAAKRAGRNQIKAAWDLCDGEVVHPALWSAVA